MRTKLFRHSVFAIATFFISHFSFGQDASRVYVEPTGWAIGTNIGLSDMWGNVGTKSVLDHYTNSKALDKPCFIGGIMGRYTIHPSFALRFMLDGGALYATDNWNYDRAKVATSQGEDGYQRYIRHQNAKDYILEGTAMFEITPFRKNPESRAAHRRGQFFFGAGVGGFYFEPYATVGTSTRWVKTYGLHLEGQGWGAGYPDNYSRFQPCIPIVIGYKWDLGERLNLGVEWMWRMTFFSYLDGVSNNYIDSAAFTSHLSAHDANLAQLIYDKGYLYGNGVARNPAGTMRGTPTIFDSYSTITVTFYFKALFRTPEWWKHYNY